MLPLRTRLRQLSPGARVGKTALAVGLAWWLGQRLGEPTPIFAALAALQAMRPTISESIRQSGGQLLGMAAGTLLAFGSARVFDTPVPLAIGLLAFLALFATTRLPHRTLLGTEPAVTALLAFVLGHGQSSWGLDRIWEAALGGALAIVLNALVLPPDYSDEAREALAELHRDLLLHVRLAVDDFLTQPDDEVVRQHLLAARAAVSAASNWQERAARALRAMRYSPVLRYSPLRRGAIERTQRIARGVDVLAMMLTHTRTALRAAWQASRRRAGPGLDGRPWYDLLEAFEQALTSYQTYLASGSQRSLQQARAALQPARQRYALLLAHSLPPDDPREVDRAALLSELEHLLDDLAAALADEAPARPSQAVA